MNRYSITICVFALSILGAALLRAQIQPNFNKEDENGKRQGQWVYYHPSGNLKTIENYSDNLLDGIRVTLNDRGYLNIEEYYVRGKLHGTQKIFDGFARLMELKEFNEGVLSGIYKKFNPNTGKLSEEGTFVNNEKHGKYIWYYDNGNPAVAYTYKMGMIEGEAIEYFRDGGIAAISTYQANELNGSHKEFYQDGKLKIEGQYKNGEKSGKWYIYDENGKKKLLKN
ncbi:MAG: toxin-antitoxin system YwqK family antitoxin [Thermaurantimonas sp.]